MLQIEGIWLTLIWYILGLRKVVYLTNDDICSQPTLLLCIYEVTMLQCGELLESNIDCGYCLSSVDVLMMPTLHSIGTTDVHLIYT